MLGSAVIGHPVHLVGLPGLSYKQGALVSHAVLQHRWSRNRCSNLGSVSSEVVLMEGVSNQIELR